MKDILTFLETSFEDDYISKSEKKALKEVISEKSPSKRELDWLRSEIFKLAQSKLKTREAQNILEWLENANKLILPKLTEPSRNEVYFSPGPGCLGAILGQIAYATKTIDICVFTISDDRIKDKLLYAKNKGIKIRIITDNDKSFDRGSDIQFLSDNNIAIKVDTTDHHMHHKFAIFDSKTIITGSYNWTRSASEYNQENIVVINDAHTATRYTDEFERLWQAMAKY